MGWSSHNPSSANKTASNVTRANTFEPQKLSKGALSVQGVLLTLSGR